MTPMTSIEKAAFPKLLSKLRPWLAGVKMCLLQDVKQSGFETALLVDPVDDFAIGRVAADGFAQELADSGVVVLFNCVEQLTQLGFEHVPWQVIFVGRHDHRVGSCRDIVADQQFFIELFTRTQTRELD